jgi:hypothetical protein
MDRGTRIALVVSVLAVWSLNPHSARAEVTLEERSDAIWALAYARFSNFVTSEDSDNTRLAALLRACDKNSMAEILERKNASKDSFFGFRKVCSDPANAKHVLALSDGFNKKTDFICGAVPWPVVKELSGVYDGFVIAYGVGFSAAARIKAKESSGFCDQVARNAVEAIEK